MNEKIQTIITLLNSRRLMEAKRMILGLEKDLLELEIYKEFHDTIKNKVRNLGRTNILTASEIDEEIIKTSKKMSNLSNNSNEK